MIRSSFAGFTTARLGLTASQSALDVTGQNIANINTEGYTRQRVDLVSLNMGNGMDLYSSPDDVYIGHGVSVQGVSQIRDPFLDIRFRTEVAKLGSVDAKLTDLEDIKSILDEVGKKGSIQNQIDEFESALQKLTNQVGNKEFDSIVRSSADVLMKMFNQYAKRLENVESNAEYNFEKIEVPTVNRILNNIRELNVTIKNNQIHGNPSLELQDQRNLLIDELAGYAKIDVRYVPTQVGDSSIYLDELKISLVGENKNITLVDDDEIATFSSVPGDASGSSPNMTLKISEIPTGVNDQIFPNPATDVTSINDLLTQIQDLSTQIRTGQEASTDVSALITQRDTLISSLGTHLDIEILPDTKTNASGIDIDNLTIRLVGNGQKFNLIKGDKKGVLSSTNHADGSTTYSLIPADKTDSFSIQDILVEDTDIDNLNTLIGDIAKANEEIKTLQLDPASDPVIIAQKITDRDALITNLQNNMNVKVTPSTETLADGTPIEMKNLSLGGIPLVNGSDFSKISSKTEANGTVIIQVEPMSEEINEELIDGSLKGALEMINCSGSFDAEATSPKGFGYYMKMLDTLAVKIASVFNEANQYTDASGVLHEMPLFGTNDGEPMSARNICIHENWANGSYGIVATTSPDQSPIGASDNIVHMIAQFTTKLDYTTDINGTERNLFHGTFKESLTNIQSVLGLDIQSTKSSLDNHMGVTIDLANNKDSVSGVSLDEEGINLIQYQKSYSAAARLMTTLDEALNTLLNMGVVGK